MNKLSDRKQINKYIFLFSLTYMISYMTRINYGAVILEIENATQISKTSLSMAITGSAITYGTGQIISGICGDRLSPKKLISCGLMLTVLMNLLIPFCSGPYQMLAVWCVNGFAQSFMWPPLVRLMSALFTMDTYKKASVKVSWGSSIGTILIYLLSPLLIATVGWKAVFWVSAFCGIVMLFIWNANCCDISCESTDRTEEVQKKGQKVGWSLILSPLMLGVMLAIVMQGMLRDGVTTWMPTYISETYHLSSVISILTSVILPIFSIICYEVAAKLYRKYFQNPLLCAGVIFGAGLVAALVLYISTGQSAAFSAIFAAILTGSMHGVNVMLICMIPPFFQKYGNVSTVSGVLNSCTYVGSALSTFGTAVLAEYFDWRVTILVWAGIALIGTALCFLCARPWEKCYSSTE